MNEQMKRIEGVFTALKADIMLSEADPEMRDRKIAKLREEEEAAKDQLKQDIAELRNLLKESEEYSKILRVKTHDALLLLAYRELKRIHWHLDQATRPET